MCLIVLSATATTLISARMSFAIRLSIAGINWRAAIAFFVLFDFRTRLTMSMASTIR